MPVKLEGKPPDYQSTPVKGLTDHVKEFLDSSHEECYGLEFTLDELSDYGGKSNDPKVKINTFIGAIKRTKHKNLDKVAIGTNSSLTKVYIIRK